MNADRRIITPDSLPPSMRRERATQPARMCLAPIVLDGVEYTCKRDHVDGIHDAFVTHHDQGLVRW